MNELGGEKKSILIAKNEWDFLPLIVTGQFLFSADNGRDGCLFTCCEHMKHVYKHTC